MKAKSVIGAFFFILFSFALVLAQQTIITGKLVGSDGKTMPKAHVHLKSSDPKIPALSSLEVDKDGGYKITVNAGGLLIVEFTGVNHQRKYVPVFVETDANIKLNVKLAANEYNTEFTDLTLIDDFKNINPTTGKNFQKQADGTYLVEFETKKDTVEYEIFGLEKNSRIINGTQSDDYIYDGDGDYRSIVRAKEGKVRVVFDPKKLIRASTKAEAAFDEKNPRLAAFAEIYDGMEARERELDQKISSAMQKGKNPQEILQEFTEADKAKAVKAKIGQEKDPFLRQVLILDYFSYYEQEKKDENLALLAMDEIPANSALWALRPYLINLVLGSSKRKEKTEAYFEKFLAENKNDDLKAQALLGAIQELKVEQKDDKVKQYLSLLEKNYPNTQAARVAKMQFSGDENIKVGVPVPEFSVLALGESQKNYSSESMKGKYYLIDFWATWCGPCVGEMPELHKVYDKFKGNNFEILSLSFDESPDDIKVFREAKWKMPWLHTFVENGFRSDLAKRFGVFGIPKPILVDPTGKIVASQGQLRGGNLEKTLAKVLGQAQ